MSATASGSSDQIVQTYLPVLRNRIALPLLEHGAAGIDTVAALLHEYHLNRDDVDAINDLTQYKGADDSFKRVESKVKGAFTRKMNAEKGSATKMHPRHDFHF